MTTELISAHGWTWGHLALAAIVLALFFWQAYRWTLVSIPPFQRLFLLMLRLVWSLGLLWCLWEPVAQSTVRKQIDLKNRAVVMLDASLSMGISDQGDNKRWQQVRNLAGRLERLFAEIRLERTEWLAFGSHVRPWNEKMVPVDRQSLLLREIREVAEQQPASGVANTLFLVTDGGDTAETPAAEAIPSLRARNIRVFPLLLSGVAQPPPLARIVRVAAPQQVALNQAFDLRVDARLRANRPVSFKMVVERDGQVVGQKILQQCGEGVTRVTFPFRAEAAQSSLYTVKLMDAEGKKEFSRMSAVVLAKTRDVLRVLYVQGAVDWEYRFVRQAIRPNASMVMKGVTHIKGDKFLLQETAQSSADSKELSVLAMLQAGMNDCDVFVFSNVDPKLLNEESQKVLLQFIQKRGGGILFFTGNAGLTAGFRGTLLEQLMPVIFDEKPVLAGDDPKTTGKANLPPTLCALQLTPEGLASEIWGADAATSASLGQPPPTFEKYIRIQQAKPAAQILAVHPADQMEGKPRPLMVSQNMGAGRVVFLGVDGLWRWRMNTPAIQRDYDRFWQQLLLWLGGRVENDTLEADRSRCQPQEEIHLVLRVRKADAGNRLWVKSLNESEREISLVWNASRTEGKGIFLPVSEGEVIFTARNKSTTLCQQAVDVSAIDLEREYCSLNETLLQQLARETNGQCLTEDNLEIIPSLFHSKTETATHREQKPLWHEPWIFLLILGAFVGEITLRQRFKLT
ncbi:MAG: hypothetical protein PHV34_10135 [Verrucomicrobiae bacterium]|nr:hypothetical protein [Verrucomicrobiae bacterium]